MMGIEWNLGTRRAPITIATMIAVVAGWSCIDATDVEILEISGSGVLFGQVFLDLDGSGGPSAADEPLADADVVLVASATSSVIEQATTDSLGLFVLFEVPLGTYRLALDSVVLGDSLTIIEPPNPITIALGDTAAVQLGATFEQLSLEEALAAPVGRRVFTSGIALNTRINFGDGQVHFEGDSASLRALNVERSTLNVGDSVRLLGRVVADNGRPALDEVTPFVLIPLAGLVTPTDLTTARAATADDEALDAALVRIRTAEISDTATTPEGHFRFWANDGSDSVEVMIRDFLVPSVNIAAIRPDTTVRLEGAIGLLSPVDDAGTVRWRLLPRGDTDIAVATKLADIGVTTSLDTVQASVGDTVEITVVATNVGPLRATGVQVADTIPAGLSFLSATATVGSYDDATSRWDLGDLVAGSADTLRINVEVEPGASGVIRNIARRLALLFEVDPDPSDDADFVDLTIS